MKSPMSSREWKANESSFWKRENKGSRIWCAAHWTPETLLAAGTAHQPSSVGRHWASQKAILVRYGYPAAATPSEPQFQVQFFPIFFSQTDSTQPITGENGNFFARREARGCAAEMSPGQNAGTDATFANFGVDDIPLWLLRDPLRIQQK